MAIEVLSRDENASITRERWGVRSDGGELMSWAGMTTVRTRFAGAFVGTLLIGGVGTAPEYRRGGHVRAMLDEAFRQAKDKGWAVSLLHPFSFSYYRKFGYERVADHLIVEFPLSKLEFVPRCANLERVRRDEQIGDVLSVYESFSKGRSVMMYRSDGARYPLDKSEFESATYLHRDADGQADGYITLSISKELDVNHYRGGWLNVKEMAYTSREALESLFGFMRMFDGEVESVRLDNIAMSPEVDWILRHYAHTTYRILPDIMARVLDTEALLTANDYPREQGEFTLKVTDDRHIAEGVWRVRYGDCAAEVARLSDQASGDICVDVAPLAQLLYGAVDVDMRTLPYLARVNDDERARDFLRAFPKRPCGMFEHF